MRLRPLLISAFLVLAAVGWLGESPSRSPAYPAGAQQAATQAPVRPAGTIQAEANLVLVDAIVTDKKGNYIRDLEAKDFHVYQDDTEQPITSFSRGSEAKGPNAPGQKHYLVLFFDNSTMETSDQVRARQAAAQFIEKTASNDRLIAVVDYGGTLRLVQNFTADTELLKHAVEGVKFASVQPNEPSEVTTLVGASLTAVSSDFGARSLLFAIRDLSKKLRPVPGRKTLILFSAGFPLTPERMSELTATIDAANKANVAIYPLDVRGLFTPSMTPPPGTLGPGFRPGPGADLQRTPFPHEDILLAALLAPALPQRPGGGAGGVGVGGIGGGGIPGGGGRPGGGGAPIGGGGVTGGGAGGRGSGGTGGGSGSAGGGTRGGAAPGAGGRATGGASPGSASTGSRGGTSGARGGGGGGYNPAAFNPFTNQQPLQRQIIPAFPDSATTNQQVLYALANGTGGFPIFNTNGFLEGLEKITRELDEYYILGYVPPRATHDGSYHKIKVQVGQKGLSVRARSGYYDMKGSDPLAGAPTEKTLEARVASPQAGNVTIKLAAPYFYTAANQARVNLAMDIPGDAFNLEKERGKFHGELNLLGLAYREDGTVAARFSDTAKLNMDKKAEKELSKGSYPYQNSFDIAPGKYNLKMVVSTGGDSFAKLETPLVIEPFNGKQFGLSGVALSDHFYPVSEVGTNLDEALLEERKPLVAKNYQFVPSATNHFSRDEKVVLYVEVYEPLLLSKSPPRVGIIFNVVNRKTNQQEFTSNTRLVNSLAQAGNLVIPVADQVPMDKFQPGEYRLDVVALDERSNKSSVHSVDFALE